MVIEFARGDTYQKGFILKRNGQPVTDTFTNVYFTVKQNYEESDYIFQKKMSAGGITSDGNGHFTLYIEPSDTNGLSFGEYDCDIEFVGEGYKRTFAGVLKLTKEVTHQGNE